MFIGREAELQELNQLYESGKFEMPVIYGRRRVGKSTLIREFSSGKKVVTFTAVESTLEKNLELFSKSVYQSLLPGMSSLPAFKDFESAFDFLNEQAKNTRIIVVIDEYPYLAESDKSISSRLQYYIDTKFSEGKMFLILCGSSMSFMENQVLGYQSPLYGRRTAQLKILPFDYFTSSLFVPAYSNEDKALVYGVTGGIPKYLELFNPQKSVHENIKQLFFNDSGYLYEEPANLLKQELRDAANYNAVIEALAHGANRVNELTGKTHLDTATISYCLKALTGLGMIRKETAITEENNKKKTHYIICDHMFNFWYRFVPDAQELILTKNGSLYYEEMVKSQLSDYMGTIFEDMCKSFIIKQSIEKKLSFPVLKTGKWWGTNPVKKREEIDVIAINSQQKKILIGECKYRKEQITKPVLDTLLERGDLLPDNLEKYFCLFSKSGFDQEVVTISKEKGIVLYTLDSLYIK